MGMTVMLLAGLIHLYNAPGEYQDAPYMGILFFGFFLASIISATGIGHGQFQWGWMLGALLSIGAIVGYLISRSVGFPFIGSEDWGPPLAYFSLFLEVFYFIPFLRHAYPYLRRALC